MTMTEERQAAHLRTGSRGEDIATQYLIDRGYTIIDRNVKNSAGEIDIIAKQNNRTIFVEVKTTDKSHNTALEGAEPIDNLSPHKIKKLCRAIHMYLQGAKSQSTWQLDAVLVYLGSQPRPAIKHLEHLSIDW